MPTKVRAQFPRTDYSCVSAARESSKLGGGLDAVRRQITSSVVPRPIPALSALIGPLILRDRPTEAATFCRWRIEASKKDPLS